MSDGSYEVVCWPDIQYLFGIEGFEDNATLINDEQGMIDYGSSAYYVDSDWLRRNMK